MIWRYVAPRELRLFQYLTFAVTAILGAAILVAPDQTAVRLTTIEEVINPVYWATPMIAVAVIGALVEGWASRSDKAVFLTVVSYCHMVLAGLTFATAAIAMVGVTRQWWAFGGPALGLYLTAAHITFIRRRPRA